MSRGQRLAVIGLVAADTVMLIAALVLSLALRYDSTLWPDASPGLTHFTVIFAALTLLVLLVSFAANRLYDLEMLFSGHREYAAVVKAGGYAIALVLIAAFLADEPVSRGALLLFWLVAMPSVLGCRFLIRRVVFRLRESGRFVSKWLVVGTDAHAAAVAKQLNWPASAGIRVVGFLDDYRPVGSHVTDGLCVLGDPRTVREVVRQRAVSTLVVVPHATSWESYRDLLELAAENDGVRIKLAPGLQHLVTTSAHMTDSGFLPLVSLEPLRITGFDVLLKRTLDYAAGLLLLALAAPFWALCWLAARVDRSGQLLTRQRVLGQRHARFSLVILAAPVEPQPARWPARQAWSWRRVVAESRLGKLPNVINVLCGHMSLVGPRAVVESGGKLSEPRMRNLLRVRPGLTGPAADISRGEGPEEQMLKDIAYVRDYSIWLDIRLLFASLKRMLQRRQSLPSSHRLVRREEPESPAVTVVEETT